MDALPLSITSRGSKPKHDHPDPGPKPAESHIPDHVKTLAVDLPPANLDNATRQALEEFQRAAHYIAAGKA
jgi:hypothetical protein